MKAKKARRLKITQNQELQNKFPGYELKNFAAEEDKDSKTKPKGDQLSEGFDYELMDDLARAGANFDQPACIFTHPDNPKVNGRPTLCSVGSDPVSMEFFGLGWFNHGYVKLPFFSKPGYVDKAHDLTLIGPAQANC